MKSIFHILLFLFPFFSFSQFGNKELYVYSRLGLGMGLTDIHYTSTIQGNSADIPRTVAANIGGGVITEIGMGMKLTRNLYCEPFVSYMHSEKNYTIVEGSTDYISSFSSNRFNIGLNAKYYVPINPNLFLDVYVGTSYRIPQDIVVETEAGEERIVYTSSAGMHWGFGGNYTYGDFVFSSGLRYRYENYKINVNRNLPQKFLELNPYLSDLNILGVDITFSVAYNF